MYVPSEMTNFALMNFERGLDGLTDEEARVQLTKADGTKMNAISWLVGHMAWHWSTMAAYANGQPQPATVRPFTVGPDADPTPPPLADALKLLSKARAESIWTATADDALLSSSSEEYRAMLCNLVPVETVGTALMRAILHTWYHTGEVNAIRQMLGHPEIVFVGPVNGLIEWRPDDKAIAVEG
jgi:hypothetical protein